MEKQIIKFIENIIFNNKKIVVVIFAALTLFFLYSLQFLKIDSGFNKLLPVNHKFMKTFVEYKEEFGGANRIIIAVLDDENDMFNVDYFSALKEITDEAFFISGVKRSQIYSIFTPNVSYTEVVEDGIQGGTVVPNDFELNQESIDTVKENIYKANIIGRLVANDHSGALISVQLQEINPDTGKKLDYFYVADQLEKNIREKYQEKYPNINIHIIGFAKYIGDISNGTKDMIQYFLITIFILAILLIYFSQSILFGLAPILCSVIAVVWQLGLLPLMGYGIDPMTMLVPFLILAIGTSHGIQILSRVKNYLIQGVSLTLATRYSFRSLFIPGLIALLSDTLGFFSILMIDVGIIKEMALTASIGVAIVILTNLLLLPVLMSGFDISDKYKDKLINRLNYLKPIWCKLASTVNVRFSCLLLCISIVILIFSFNYAVQVKIGDQHAGVPELHQNSQYNVDSSIIAKHFSIGVDLLNVIVETRKEGCIDHEVMNDIENFTWQMKYVPGVQYVNSLPGQAKAINAGWNEGYLKWYELPRNPSLLSQATAYIPTATGLLNADCSVMPVHIFTEDHKQETIEIVVSAINQFKQQHTTDKTNYRLATGNVGVMAATNQEVQKSQFPILFYMFTAIIILVYLGFRSVVAVGIIIYPIIFVSMMVYAMMAILNIGLKVNTLPVVALGIGIGVDYGIYLYNRLNEEYKLTHDLYKAYISSFSSTGYSILFTGLALSIGVVTWLFSPLKFQTDMGILLVFMFIVNMLAALLLIPALMSLYIHFKKI